MLFRSRPPPDELHRDAELGIPVKLIGVGERASDLVEFEPEAFVAALLDA